MSALGRKTNRIELLMADNRRENCDFKDGRELKSRETLSFHGAGWESGPQSYPHPQREPLKPDKAVQDRTGRSGGVRTIYTEFSEFMKFL